MKEVNRKIKEKQAAKTEAKQKLVEKVKNHGGPCVTSGDVNKVLTQHTSSEKMEIIKDEIRYLKTVLRVGVADKRLVLWQERL